MIPLVAVAHGSRDPRSAASIHALLDVVRSLRPELDVRGAFLDLCAPRLSDVLRGPAVVVPLLLGKAFHARVDVPAAVVVTRQDRVVPPGRQRELAGLIPRSADQVTAEPPAAAPDAPEPGTPSPAHAE